MSETGQADRLAYRPEEAADLLGVGRDRIYALIASGELESIKMGQSRRISRAALERYIARAETETAGSA